MISVQCLRETNYELDTLMANKITACAIERMQSQEKKRIAMATAVNNKTKAKPTITI